MSGDGVLGAHDERTESAPFVHTGPMPFVLARPHGTVRGSGVRSRFTDASAAAQALRERRVDAVVGAIPFVPGDDAALFEPTSLLHCASPLPARTPHRHRLTGVIETPDLDGHRTRVAEAIAAIAAGQINKVVLARMLEAQLDSPIEIDDLLGALAAGNTEHNAFAVDTGTSWLLGASPELLVRKHGREIWCHPYAGSAPRSPDPTADRAAHDALAASTKDRAEHAFVVEHLREQLTPLCTELDVATAPQLLSTGEMWHLATPIRGRLAAADTSALDLALALSPTPAVCGTPTAAAAAFIAEHERPRGLYAGAVGWADAHGDGEWMVTIRALELGADRRHLRTWAGGGIVADSDPDAEVAETSAKLRTVFNALGVI